jgi:hypothetical protein
MGRTENEGSEAKAHLVYMIYKQAPRRLLV